ncbi:MAG TPA: hypothetical protein VF812_08330 [Ktedonobacterales bacterium]
MQSIVSFIGAFFRHIIGVLLLCWRRMLRAGLIAFAFGVTLALLVAVIATGQAFPGALALAVAVIFGGVLAYCVALTVLIEEFLLGVVDLIRLLEGDAKAVAHLTATVAEREVGDVGQGLRRLIGLPISSARPRDAAPPTLPTLPRYPTTSARPAPDASAPTSEYRSRRALETAAIAAEALGAVGASALAAQRASRASDRAPSATAATTTATPSAPASTTGGSSGTQETQPPVGGPVPADRLPRIGWTYEHEAIRPARVTAASVDAAPPASAEPSAASGVSGEGDTAETLAELAGAGALAAGGISARHATDGATDDQPQPAVEEPTLDATAVVAPASSSTPEMEPLDVAVVSATGVGALGPAAPTLRMDDGQLDDERLAEPAMLAAPDEEAVAEAISVAPAAPVTPEPELAEPEPAWDAHEPVDVAPVVAPVVAPISAPRSAPVTSPLAEAEPLDLAFARAAPVTSPLPHELAAPLVDPEMVSGVDAPMEVREARETSAPAPEPLADPVTEATEAPATSARLEGATLVATLPPSAEPETTEPESAPEVTSDVTPDATTDVTPVVTQEAAPEAEVEQEAATPPMRSALARITRPVEDLGTAFATLDRSGPVTGPRASAPESGLWERLSQALIERAGSPASPFAAPLAPRPTPPESPDSSSTAETDGTPQG